PVAGDGAQQAIGDVLPSEPGDVDRAVGITSPPGLACAAEVHDGGTGVRGLFQRRRPILAVLDRLSHALPAMPTFPSKDSSPAEVVLFHGEVRRIGGRLGMILTRRRRCDQTRTNPCASWLERASIGASIRLLPRRSRKGSSTWAAISACNIARAWAYYVA